MSIANWLASGVCTIDGFLSKEECAALIAKSEAESYEAALISTRSGAVRNESVRNNDRVIRDDPEFANQLWLRLKPLIPPTFHNVWSASGLNDRLRFYRYEPGQYFDWHSDGRFRRSQSEESHFTFMVYLNDADGGETVFRKVPDFPDDDLNVTPKLGMALLFHHPLWHRGNEVRSGRKYVLRSDLMYRLQDDDD